MDTVEVLLDTLRQLALFVDEWFYFPLYIVLWFARARARQARQARQNTVADVRSFIRRRFFIH